MGPACPQCKEPVPWSRRLWRAHLWAKWQCHGCGATLKFNAKNRLLITVFFYAVVFSSFGAGWWGSILGPLAIAFVLSLGLMFSFALLFGERVSIVTYGPGYCPSCGYDRTGLVSDRCPECGQVLVAYSHRANPQANPP